MLSSDLTSPPQPQHYLAFSRASTFARQEVSSASSFACVLSASDSAILANSAMSASASAWTTCIVLVLGLPQLLPCPLPHCSCLSWPPSLASGCLASSSIALRFKLGLHLLTHGCFCCITSASACAYSSMLFYAGVFLWTPRNNSSMVAQPATAAATAASSSVYCLTWLHLHGFCFKLVRALKRSAV